MTNITFRSSGGLELTGIIDESQDSNRKAIILAHGITVDKEEDGIFRELSKLLHGNGYTVLRFDFRGHGKSEGKSLDLTIAGELKDVEAAVSYLENRKFKKVGLLGASFGGGISALYVSKNPKRVKCLCLWYPCLNYDHVFLNPVTSWLKPRKRQMGKDLKEKGWTTLGSNNFIVGKQLFDEMEHVFPFDSLKRMSIPTLIVHGTGDTYVPFDDSKKYVKYLKYGQLIPIKEADHGFQDVRKHSDAAQKATLKFFQKYL